MNNIETAIIDEIIKDNSDNFAFLQEQIPFLLVKNREYTGVGIYTNFSHSKHFDKNDVNTLLTGSKKLKEVSLKYEINYVLDITDGIINYLEIVTNGEDWKSMNSDVAFEKACFSLE